MTLPDDIVACILLAGLFFSIGKKKLTVPAALAGAVIGWIVYAGGGLTGLAMNDCLLYPGDRSYRVEEG